jgi:rod shape-determining protein MreD
VRRTLITVGLLGLALTIQLSVLNGLRLPGGGVPDIVLVLVAALAITAAPIGGMVTGFLAGLCLDLAPPGSAVFGEYALVFFLVSWAAGRFGGLLDKSALASAAVLAAVVAAGEGFVAALSRALDPAQVDLSDIRHVLPSSVAYDLILVPFAVLLAVAVRDWAARTADTAAAEAGLVGPGGSASGNVVLHTRSARAGRKHKSHQPKQPRFTEGFARPHGGRLSSGLGGSSPASGVTARRQATPRLRLAGGVAGSSARQHGGLAGPGAGAGSGRAGRPGVRPGGPGGRASTVNLRLAGRGRRTGGVLGNPIGTRHGGPHVAASRVPRGSTAARFRPHPGSPGGSAAMGSAALVQRQAWRRPTSLSFRARRGDASVGRLLRTALALPRPHRTATPRFRGTTSPRPAALAGSGDPQAILSMRRRSTATPRLRLASRPRGHPLAQAGRGRPGGPKRPATPHFHSRPQASSALRASKKPRFSYGRRSVLSFLTRRRIGGSWLASRQVGTRSGVWLISRRTGGRR